MDLNKELLHLKKLMEEGKIKLLSSMAEPLRNIKKNPDGTVVEDTVSESVRALLLAIKGVESDKESNKKRIYYETTDYYVLPEKYHLDHEYCFYLHDQLVKIITEGERLKIFHQNLKLGKNKPPKKKGEDILTWMRKNGYSKQAKKFLIKNIFAATLSDALSFIHTALKCSDKGKLSVTFAILRKPLKDNLFILELLNADKRNFFKKFKNPSKELDICSGFQPEERKRIIKANCERIKFPAEFTDLLFDIRYNKKVNGLEPLFQKANHITTGDKHIQTEEENLNMIFSDDSSRDSQWSILYKTLPWVLRYFVDTAYFILNSDISKKLKDELSLMDILYQRRHYPQFCDTMPFNISCRKCKKSIKATKKVLDTCEKDRFYTCSCGEQESIITLILTH